MAMGSLMKAQQQEIEARQILWYSFALSLALSFIMTFLIIRSILLPLRRLEKAAHRVGQGDFDVHLDTRGKDEITEVSAAFNTMAGKLGHFRRELERKNNILSESLNITNQQKKDLEKVNAELDRFVHTVSHDIASPLMGIQWYGQYLKNHAGERLNDKERESLEGICHGVTRLSALIEDLLTLTRISRVKSPYEDVSMGSLIQEIRERLEFDIKKFQVEFSIQEGMPVIRCDRIKFTEVFYNLINNAIKFSSKNGDCPRIEIGYHDKDTDHEFYVKDNGIGIDPADQDKIFDMFKRGKNAQEYEGTGAGLSIVKDAIEDHGGKIWVESQKSHGACFYLTLPKIKNS